MRRWMSLAVIGALASLVVPGALADGPTGGAPGLDPCDWSSFRNDPANSGSSSCTALGVTTAPTLVPQLFYRTRDSVTATPAVVDGVVYVGSWDGTFYAFDGAAAGVGDPSLAAAPGLVEPLWTFQIDDTNGVSFGRIVSSASVVDAPDGTRLVVFAGGATVYVLDAADGAPLAQLCLDPRTDADAAAQGGRCSGSGDSEIEVETSPVILPEADGSFSVLVGQDNHNRPGIGRTGVVKLRLDGSSTEGFTLDPVWKFDPEAGATYTGTDLLTFGSGTGDGCGGVWSTPAVDVAHDLVVLGTASCSMDGVEPEEVAGEKVFGIRLSDGSPLWRFDPPRPWGSRTDDDFGASIQLIGFDGMLLAGAAGKDGWYYALDAVTGEERWSTQFGQPGHAETNFAIGGAIGSPAVGAVGGRPAVFATTAISTPVGAPLDEGTPESFDASLAEDPLRLLSLHALDATNGEILWRSPLTRASYGHPTYSNGVVYVPSTAGLSVQAFHADTGLPLWTSPAVGAVSSGVAVTDTGVFFGAGTRQTDAGFKIQGEDSTVPEEVQAILELTPAADLLGADPQERLSGIWGFAPATGLAGSFAGGGAPGRSAPGPSGPPGELHIVVNGENNRLNAYDVHTLEERVLIPSAADDPVNGLDINAEICFVPDGVPWKPDGELWFIAGEDTEQNSAPGVIKQGWGIFRLTGDTFSTLAAEEIAKLVPDSFLPSESNPENYGCGVLPDGRLVTGAVGGQLPTEPATGELVVWFIDSSHFARVPGGDRTSFVRVPHCKVDVGIGTAGGIEVDGTDLYIASNRPNLDTGEPGGIYRYDTRIWPTGETAAGGCGRTDQTGEQLADADRVGKQLFIPQTPGILTTPSDIVHSGRGTFFISNVFTGTIVEYGKDGLFRRPIVTTTGQLGGITPFGITVDSHGTLWIADIGVVGPGPAPGEGAVYRVQFDAADNPGEPELVDDALEFPDGIGTAVIVASSPAPAPTPAPLPLAGAGATTRGLGAPGVLASTGAGQSSGLLVAGLLVAAAAALRGAGGRRARDTI